VTPHESYSRYSNDGCRCTACRAANAAYQRTWRAQRKAAADVGTLPVPHGEGGYTNYGCRCEECRAAARAREDRRRVRLAAILAAAFTVGLLVPPYLGPLLDLGPLP
jgi:hypothetical protein